MQPNYAFVLETAAKLRTGDDARILDYGCGSGEIVAEGIRRGMDVFGVDIFYDGNPARLDEVRRNGLLGSRVFAIEKGTIPFPDASFDVVVSNMVFEHVVDLEGTLSEVRRILKPGGRFLCLFPTLETIREGHCGIPFIHWFGHESRARRAWMYFFRRIGLGYNKGGKTVAAWCSDYLAWLDAYTCYRGTREVEYQFGRKFAAMRGLEADYVSFRLRLRSPGLERLTALVPFRRTLFRWICRRFASLVIVLEKR